METTKYRSA